MKKYDTLSIVEHPAVVLATPGEKVSDPASDDMKKLFEDMVLAMREARGVGLAAQQIGKALRVCVIEVGGVVYKMANPKITARSKETETEEEGCLSVPGKFFPLARAAAVQVRYTDENGTDRKLKARGLLARAAQHELDHLAGVIILDRVKEQKTKHLQ